MAVSSLPLLKDRPATAAAKTPRGREIEAALALVRPAVQDDGGDVSLESVDGEVVTIRFHGACTTCPASEMTLRDLIERHLVERVPGVERVVAAED